MSTLRTFLANLSVENFLLKYITYLGRDILYNVFANRMVIYKIIQRRGNLEQKKKKHFIRFNDVLSFLTVIDVTLCVWDRVSLIPTRFIDSLNVPDV